MGKPGYDEGFVTFRYDFVRAYTQSRQPTVTTPIRTYYKTIQFPHYKAALVAATNARLGLPIDFPKGHYVPIPPWRPVKITKKKFTFGEESPVVTEILLEKEDGQQAQVSSA